MSAPDHPAAVDRLLQPTDEGGRWYVIKRQHADVGPETVFRVVCLHQSCQRPVGRIHRDAVNADHLLVNHAVNVHGSGRLTVLEKLAAAGSQVVR